MFQRKRTEQDDRTASLIAQGTTIHGNVRFAGALYLDSLVKGTVLAEEADAVFTLGEHGTVQGDIRVPVAVIHGVVEGNLHISERLELAATARIVGDVHYRTAAMAAGSQLNGRMRRITSQDEHSMPPADADADADTRAASSPDAGPLSHVFASPALAEAVADYAAEASSVPMEHRAAEAPATARRGRHRRGT